MHWRGCFTSPANEMRAYLVIWTWSLLNKKNGLRFISLIWSPLGLLPFVYSIVTIRSIWICVRLLYRDYSEHDLNARSPDFERSDHSVVHIKDGGRKLLCFTCRWNNNVFFSFIGRRGNVKYSARCYYFSFFWLRNQLKLVSLCFMMMMCQWCTIFIRFHYQYPAFSYSAISQA